MKLNDVIRSRMGRDLARVFGLSVAVAGLALCAYAGGQPRAGTQAPARPEAVTLTAIKARAATGRALKPGPSANVNQKIRLVGSGFDGNVSVMFTGFADSTWLVRPLEVKGKRVTVAVPAQVVTGAVALSDPESGQSGPLTLQVVPTIDTLTAENAAPGGRLLIDGNGFARDARVTFKGVAQPVVPTVVSPTRLDLIIPAGAQSGKITVVTGGGTSKPAKLVLSAAASAGKPAPGAVARQ